ncbi:sterol carrier protein domain-containing protein [[Ruminococcus] torques]|nr:sterol carrier protein domain-containing protein [[Ruminococcus] torques]
MARIVCLPEFLKAMIVDETETLECSFAVLDSILHKNSCVWKLTSVQGEKEIHVQETEDSQGVFPIADLTEYLFGRIDLEELREREGVICTAELGEELEKIEKLTRVYFNEVV